MPGSDLYQWLAPSWQPHLPPHTSITLLVLALICCQPTLACVTLTSREARAALGEKERMASAGCDTDHLVIKKSLNRAWRAHVDSLHAVAKLSPSCGSPNERAPPAAVRKSTWAERAEISTRRCAGLGGVQHDHGEEHGPRLAVVPCQRAL